MLPNILIGVGILFTGLGFVGLILLNIKPFINAIQVYFLHNAKDLSYDSDKEEATLEKEYKFLKRTFGIFLGIGLVCLMFGLDLKYAPRGNASFLAQPIDGVTTGNDNIKYQQEKENNIVGNYVATNGNSYLYYVTVSEKTIYFNGQKIGDTEEFEEYLKKLDRGHTIFIEDDFAVSPTYHKVEELLNDYGMKYETESDE